MPLTLAALATLAFGLALLAGVLPPWPAYPVIAALWLAAVVQQRRRR
ncbi:MAG TPA: hypothetical protein PKD53_14225 [Chloroflexaceae bacterium]|nr:hypothetical protein [Chloroflexaceae bacterium]